ncbi:inverse autotransporter beta domain-containing protein [Rubinisphaera margarita]|uniref:inverse autotransporter beta domain-containing protein n=1 Tax=Rubinisphaera margarita TaxID=2909586 RepID=UPI001EE8AA6A|nr:inverse autotransporter beta domain-containing protein [Rubinisphaera margarita]MCG6156034.1 right-handed parallel beta-helix repeat-containing protein [Rubinisphaera margarita]
MPAFGRDTGLTYVEVMPYILEEDERIFFSDLRGFLTNEGNVGGNVGAGFRFLEPNEVLLLGVNATYGIDQSLEEAYQQMTLGLEGMTRFGSVTSNFYFPIGNDQKILESTTGNVRMQGTQVVIDRINTIGQAMQGADVNLGVFMPGEFAEAHNIETIATYYHFTGSNVDDINGVKLAVEGEFVPFLKGQVAVSNDDTFGTNVTVGMSFRFGTNDVPERRLERQLRKFIDTNYNVIVSQRTELGNGIALVNPQTGAAYEVRHVSNTGTDAADGSADNPFQSIAAAQDDGADIIFLKSGSVFTDSVTLAEGQMLIGEGTDFVFDSNNFGSVEMAGTRPEGELSDVIFTGTGGDPLGLPAIILADSSAVAGVRIVGDNGTAPSMPGAVTAGAVNNGIVANGLADFQIHNVRIDGVNGNGIDIAESTNGLITNVSVNGAEDNGIEIRDHDGYLQFADISVSNSGRHGMLINGGRGETVVAGDLELNNNTNSALKIQGLELITTVDDQGTATTDDDVEEDIYGFVAIENLLINGMSGSTGVDLDDNEGLIDIYDGEIETTDASALLVRDTSLFRMRDGIVSSENAAAVDAQDSNVNIQIESISADGGQYGIRMVDTTGTILSYGNVDDHSGGTIMNTDTAIYALNAGSVGMRDAKFVNNDHVAIVRNSDVLDLNSSYITGTNISFIEATDVKLFGMTNNMFENNSITNAVGIDYAVTKSGGYVTRLVRNEIVDSPRTFFQARTTAGVTDASLDYTFSGNDIDLAEAYGVAAKLDWTGPVSAEVIQNLITGDASNQKAFAFTTGDAADKGTFAFTDNIMGFTGRGSTGIELLAGSPVDLLIGNNLVEFRGLDGVGMRVSGSRASYILIAQNTIDDYAGGATGILFPSLHDGSTVTLNSNQITLNRFNTFVDRGIILSNVTGTDEPFVTFSSTLTNQIDGATTTYSLPNGTTTGRILINGQVAQ